VYPFWFAALAWLAAALLLLRVATGGFSGRDVADAVTGCGESGRYEESELTGEGLGTEMVSLALLAMAAGGRENEQSMWLVRLALLPDNISVEGAGVGSDGGGIL
jgi:hypothetical protein